VVSLSLPAVLANPWRPACAGRFSLRRPRLTRVGFLECTPTAIAAVHRLGVRACIASYVGVVLGKPTFATVGFGSRVCDRGRESEAKVPPTPAGLLRLRSVEPGGDTAYDYEA
jgi:hypothetical protein